MKGETEDRARERWSHQDKRNWMDSRRKKKLAEGKKAERLKVRQRDERS